MMKSNAVYRKVETKNMKKFWNIILSVEVYKVTIQTKNIPLPNIVFNNSYLKRTTHWIYCMEKFFNGKSISKYTFLLFTTIYNVRNIFKMMSDLQSFLRDRENIEILR